MTILDMVQLSTATTGTGQINLGSVVSGYQSFASAGGANNTIYSYGVQDTGNAWEAGLGTYITNASGTFLLRTTVQYSSNSSPTANGLINLSGSAVVYATMLQQDYDTFTPANSISIGANVTINTTTIFVGNSTANAVTNSSVEISQNSSGQTVSTPISVTIQNSTVNTIMGLANITLGNTTVNVISNSTQIMVQNSTSNLILTSNTISLGNSVANTFANSIFSQVINSTANTKMQPGLFTLAGAGSNQGLTVGSHGTFAAATNGYSFLTNGVLLQWNQITSNSSTGTCTFPVAFPTACFICVATSQQAWTVNGAAFVVNANSTVAAIRTGNASAAANVWVMAVGN